MGGCDGCEWVDVMVVSEWVDGCDGCEWVDVMVVSE